MTKLRHAIIGCLLLCSGVLAPWVGRSTSSDNSQAQMLAEQKHFLECLAAVYSPAFWISYNDSLYFQPKDEAQMRQLEAMKAARAGYMALTNRETRYQIASKGITSSGIDERWRRKILLPFSTTNQDLTPTLGRPLRSIARYKVVQTLPHGDALIRDGQNAYFVMDFGRGAYDWSGTNACLIKEGVKTYSDGNRFHTVEAFTNASLSKEEQDALKRVAAAFLRQAATLVPTTDTPMASEDFEACKARATDANPYMEYLLARCYLEGKGTDKNETLGMEWMKKAARSGSGDAISYLGKLGRKTP